MLMRHLTTILVCLVLLFSLPIRGQDEESTSEPPPIVQTVTLTAIPSATPVPPTATDLPTETAIPSTQTQTPTTTYTIVETTSAITGTTEELQTSVSTDISPTQVVEPIVATVTSIPTLTAISSVSSTTTPEIIPTMSTTETITSEVASSDIPVEPTWIQTDVYVAGETSPTFQTISGTTIQSISTFEVVKIIGQYGVISGSVTISLMPEIGDGYHASLSETGILSVTQDETTLITETIPHADANTMKLTYIDHILQVDVNDMSIGLIQTAPEIMTYSVLAEGETLQTLEIWELFKPEQPIEIPIQPDVPSAFMLHFSENFNELPFAEWKLEDNWTTIPDTEGQIFNFVRTIRLNAYQYSNAIVELDLLNNAQRFQLAWDFEDSAVYAVDVLADGRIRLTYESTIIEEVNAVAIAPMRLKFSQIDGEILFAINDEIVLHQQLDITSDPLMLTMRASGDGALIDNLTIHTPINTNRPVPLPQTDTSVNRAIVVPPVDQPVLIQPINNSTLYDDVPTFSWNAVANSAAYDIQIATNPEFTNLIIDDTINALIYIPSMALANGTYYWRVRGNNQAANGTWSNSLTFEIQAVKAPAPGGIIPADGTIIASSRVALSWEKNRDADHFVIDIATDPDFNDLLIAVEDVRSNRYQIRDMPQGIYYWRVYAVLKTGHPTETSDVHEFAVTYTKQPSPDDVITSATPIAVKFSWQTLRDATGYQVFVATDDAFANVIHTSPQLDAKAKGYTLPTGSELGWGEYYWRVDVIGLTANGIVPSYFIVAPALPDAPTLPKSLGLLNTATPTLEWDVIPEAVEYDVLVSTDKKFKVVDGGLFTAPTNTYTFLTDLADGSYYWQVRTRDQYGSLSKWSKASSFDVDTMPPAIPTGLNPVSGTVLSDSTPDLSWGKDREATGFVIQVSQDITFTGPMLIDEETTGNRYRIVSPLLPGTYYWRLQSVDNANNWSDVTPIQRFSITYAAMPQDGIVLKSKGLTSITFRWIPHPSATGYQIDVSDDPVFNSLIHQSGVLSTNAKSYKLPPGSELPDDIYYWRVILLGVDDVPSIASRFILSPKAPSTPKLPKNGGTPDTVGTAYPTLIWDAVNYDSPVTYDLQVGTGKKLDTILMQIAAISSTQYTLETPLANGEYLWQVRAVNHYGVAGKWSKPTSIRIETNPPPLVTPISPTDGAVVPAISMAFEWQAVPRAETYVLEIATDISFTSVVVPDIATNLTTLLPPVNFPQGQYFWHVKAMDEWGNLSDTGDIFSFTVNLQQVPANGEVLVTDTPISPTMQWQPIGIGNGYTIQIATDAAFTNIIQSSPLLDSTTDTYVFPNTLAFGQYYWRLLIDGFANVSPTYTTFYVSPQPPGIPTFAGDNTPAYTNNPQPRLRWDEVIYNGDITYEVQLAESPTLDDPIFIAGDISQTSVVVEPALDPGRYYWQVQAVNKWNAPGGWSTVRRVTIADDTVSGIWMWQEENVTNSILRDQLLDNLNLYGFDALYAQAYFTLQNGETNALADFVSTMHNAGIAVELLAGDPLWALNDNHAAATAFVQNVIDFSEAHPTERPEAIHLNIEPHTLAGWSDTVNDPGNHTIATEYLNLLSSIRTLLDGSIENIDLNVDMAFWYDEVIFTYDGVEQSLSEHILSIVDGVTVLAYRDTVDGDNGIIALSETEVAQAEAAGKNILIGLETNDVEPPSTTFCEEGAASLAAARYTIHSTFEAYSTYLGTAVHDYLGFEGLETCNDTEEEVFDELVIPDTPVNGTIIRGFVMKQNGDALGNVNVSVLNLSGVQPVRTLEDGMFNLEVPGGGLLTINFEKEGYLPIQRQVTAQWQDYALTEDVVMTQLDPLVTTVDFTSTDPIQVVEGSSITDTDGTRQARLLIPQGTSVELVLPDGTTLPTETLHIRATEYTVGDNGPSAMPGSLPATSAYTYALEYSADEAINAGATRVEFSQPIYHYNENFLNFPTGMVVPTGYYDREKGQWIPSDDGRVIEILSISNGLAEIDTEGDGIADNGIDLGVTDDERMNLAQLYSVGETLWRVPILHFTPWDCNWPWWPPLDAEPPFIPTPVPKPQLDEPDNKCGSIIECQNQALGERINVVGTEFSLNYRSDRVPGRAGNYSINIPLTDASIPSSLKRVDLEITIAGRRFLEEFPALPNQETVFTWDGLDVYGRTVSGQLPIRIRIGYVYEPVYAVPSTPDFGVIAGRSFGGVGIQPISNNRTRQEVTIWTESTTELGTLDNRNLGLAGWSLNVHHFYSPYGQILYMGNGTRRSADSMNYDIISPFAGGNSILCDDPSCGDGGPALEANLGNPQNFEVGSDGSVYIADRRMAKIRRVLPDGTITTVAGNGTPGFSGDGGPATEAQLGGNAMDITVAPDGTLYIADRNNHRIRRVTPDGIITTIAGTDEACNDYYTSGCGDGGPATEAPINTPESIDIGPDGSVYFSLFNSIRRISPDGIITRFAGSGSIGISGDGGPAVDAGMGWLSGVTLAPDGSVYISDRYNRRVRKVDSNGIIMTFAGNGAGCSLGADPCGDGGPATDGRFLYPLGLDIGPDGSLYIADAGRIRRVGANGIITTVAGSDSQSTSGDNGPATQAQITAVDTAVAADGSFFVSGNYNIFIQPVVRKISSSLPGLTAGSITIASEDSSEVYTFDSEGNHLETRNAYTGAVIYTFAYDSVGRLASITDGDGNTTVIERDGNGNPTAIVGPYGQRTTLTVDANGFLSSVSNPANETTTMAYTADGLLTSFTNPRNYKTLFTYDAAGLLVRHDDPIGGSMVLSRTEAYDDYTVDLTTGLGRTTVYDVVNTDEQDQTRTNTMPNGLQTTYDKNVDGTRNQTAPDGSSTSQLLGPDPRFGMLSPVDTNTTISTTDGLIATTTESRNATLTDTNDVFSLETLVNEIAINGRVYTQNYDNLTRTFTATTPEGRQVTTTIDDQGRPLTEQVGDLAEITYTYDSNGRILTATQNGRTITFTYNAQSYVETITDPIGRVTSFVYDDAGRVIQETLPGNRVIAYDYDANGNLISLTPPDKSAHTFTYTEIDQMASYTPPNAGFGSTTTNYTYDIDRDLQLELHADGRSLDYEYDAAGRLDAMTIARGVFTYSYDANSGKLSAITAPGGVNLAFAYDSFLITDETWSGPVAGSVNWTYDNDFRATSVSVNSLNPISMTYDSDSLLVGAGDMTLTRHTQNGLLTGTTLGNLTDAYDYNVFGEPSSYDASYSNSDLYNVDYIRDDLGRITTLTETIGGVTTVYTYHYDLAGRLYQVEEDGVLTQTYTYDANGNRLSLTDAGGTTSGTYDAQDRLLTYGSNNYTYNNHGDLTTKTNGTDVTSYDYDELGNLMGVDLPDGTAIDYLVDGTNRRVGKLVNSTLTKGFLWEADLRIIAELDGSNNVVSRFVYGEGINVPDYMIRSGVTYRILTDHLGSVRLVVNIADGVIVQRMDYDAFGRVIQDTSPGFQPFGFAGGLYDPDTGLVRFGARDYDAEAGRWTTKDPIGFNGGDANLYVYVGNDPVNFTDSAGEFIQFVAAAIAWSAIGFSLGNAVYEQSTGIDRNMNGEIDSPGPEPEPREQKRKPKKPNPKYPPEQPKGTSRETRGQKPTNGRGSMGSKGGFGSFRIVPMFMFHPCLISPRLCSGPNSQQTACDDSGNSSGSAGGEPSLMS